ncbi:MAG: alkaline shock response membrane anchor protein AmaP [Clostridia bacterium]|nr:alkaline shock response membrane anchor protein AmaP [Clostridia bacterium]
MKKGIITRVLAVFGGLTLWAFAALAVAETFFHVPVTTFVGKVLSSDTPAMVLVTALIAIVLFVLGLCCMLMLSARRAMRDKGFVMQKTENGVIGVSVKSIEGLVQSCVDQHDVIAKSKISVRERRNGLMILLHVEEAAGLNIPLAIGALQKQVKQYVTSCIGIEVQEVRVMVENSGVEAQHSPYTVERPVVTLVPETTETEAVAEDVAVEESVPAATAEEASANVIVEQELAVEAAEAEESAPVVPAMPPMAEVPEEDDRPLHQRIFGAEEQPVFVPAPPELVIEHPAEEAAEASAEETPAEEAAEELDANAVLEVVEAIAEDETLAEGEYAVADAAEYDEEVLAEQAAIDGEDEEIRE